jgi:hypothetical protein
MKNKVPLCNPQGSFFTMNQGKTLHRDAAAKSRKVALLGTMITDFEAMAAHLTREIAAEEERTKIKDPAHVKYSTWAKSVALRRDNLSRSVADLKSKLEVAKGELEAAARMRALELAESGAQSISPPTEVVSVVSHQIPFPREPSLPAD